MTTRRKPLPLGIINFGKCDSDTDCNKICFCKQWRIFCMQQNCYQSTYCYRSWPWICSLNCGKFGKVFSIFETALSLLENTATTTTTDDDEQVDETTTTDTKNQVLREKILSLLYGLEAWQRFVGSIGINIIIHRRKNRSLRIRWSSSSSSSFW